MNLTTLDNVLWAAGLLGNVALLFVLIYKQRWRTFPWFTIYTTFSIAFTLCLFAAYRRHSARLYTHMYWGGALLDFLLQIALVIEIARTVLRPAHSLMPSAYRWMLGALTVCALLAAGLVWGVHPKAPTALDAWELRGNLFSSLLICELFTVVLMTSQRFGLHWRSHVMSVGFGLTVWAIVSLAVDALHNYWGGIKHFELLDHVRMFFNGAAILFWIVSFWRNEPERKLATPEMRETLLKVSDRVSYDLAKTLGTREKEVP